MDDDRDILRFWAILGIIAGSLAVIGFITVLKWIF